MELTQRLESSQAIIGNTSERFYPEQIGFLGICGTKHPVKKGINKIGRDPQTCDIVLNLNSISRQHAVLNILSNYDFMLMDLDSPNKTKLQNKTLDPYIPYPLKNGDTVQFGQVFGIFRLLEEDSDLPMTQAIELPDTPIEKKQLSKMNHSATVTESPNDSDKDNSFIASLQPKEIFRSSNTVVSGKLPNFNDGKNFHEVDNQLPDQDSLRSLNIHSMETQVPILDHLPDAYSDSRKEMHTYHFAENKENNISIFNADSLKVSEHTSSIKEICIKPDTSYDLILSDKVESQPFNDNLESQAILPSSPILLTQDSKSNSPSIVLHQNNKDNTSKKPIKSLTDFDIMPMQMIHKKLFENQTKDVLEDIDISPSKLIKRTECNEDEVTDFEDDLEDFIKQVGNTNKFIINSHGDLNKEVNIQYKSINIFENLPIQEIGTVSESFLKNKVLNHINENKHIFKVPSQSPRKSYKNNSNSVAPVKTVPPVFDDGDANSNVITQEILDDVLRQKEPLGPVKLQETVNPSSDNVSQSFEHEDEKKIDEMVSALSSQEIRDIVGVEPKVTKLKRFPSDNSNCESTPKKVTILQLMDNDLPNSQEIKSCLAAQSRAVDTIYTSESETENDSQQGTPILFKKKHRKTSDIKLDLSKKFNAELLPSRFSTRVKKPPATLNGFKGPNKSILKSNIINDPEDDIDIDIITENILRIKSYKSRNIPIDNTSNVSIAKSRKATSKTREKEAYCDKSKSSNIELAISDKGLEKKALNINNTDNTKKTSKTKKGPNTATHSNTMQKDFNAINVSVTIGDKPEQPKKPKKTKDIEAKLTNIPETTKTRQTRSRKNPKVNHKLETNTIESNRIRLKRCSSQIDISDGTVEKQKRIKITDNTVSTVKVLRRSTRQRNKKYEITYNINNESTVYSTSPQSTKSLGVKRSATDELVSPAKKRRPASARRQKNQFVLMTAFPNEEVKSKLQNLGAVIVSDVKECTVVLTLQIKRTFKLLCAVGLGKPIVGPRWVQACVDNHVIVDPWLYLIQDEATEKRFHFNLQKSLVSKRNFLKGIDVSSTPSVIPSAPEMKLIVECSGGTWAPSPPAPQRRTWVVVSCHADRALWPALRRRGAVIVSTEFILGGVLQQDLQIDRNKLA